MEDFIILSQQDLRAAMRIGDYVEAVAEGFRLLAEGRCASPVPTQIDVAHGAFHMKPGSLPRGPTGAMTPPASRLRAPAASLAAIPWSAFWLSSLR